MNHASDELTRMQAVMGEFPPDSRRVALEPQVVESGGDANVRRWKVTFAVETGDRCMAWLMAAKPQAAGEARPGALCLHQTTKIGKDEPAGLGGKLNLHYAYELARRGYIAVVPDYPNFGEYHVDVYARGYASGTMKAIWNHMRAIDLLESLGVSGPGIPGVDGVCVDPTRIGCIGHSLGGHNALFVAAFDRRIRAAVSSCGFTRFTYNDDERRGKPGDLSDWTGPVYMPRIKERYGSRAGQMPFDFEHVLAAIAPRGVFINAPTRDVFDVPGVEECAAIVRPRYEAAGVPNNLVCVHPDCEHDFPPAVRKQAYAFMDRVLKRQQAAPR